MMEEVDDDDEHRDQANVDDDGSGEGKEDDEDMEDDEAMEDDEDMEEEEEDMEAGRESSLAGGPRIFMGVCSDQDFWLTPYVLTQTELLFLHQQARTRTVGGTGAPEIYLCSVATYMEDVRLCHWHNACTPPPCTPVCSCTPCVLFALAGVTGRALCDPPRVGLKYRQLSRVPSAKPRLFAEDGGTCGVCGGRVRTLHP